MLWCWYRTFDRAQRFHHFPGHARLYLALRIPLLKRSRVLCVMPPDTGG
jgi:hypothetical protein